MRSLIKSVASQTSGSTPRDLRALAADAGANAVSRLMKSRKDYENSHAKLAVENGNHSDDEDDQSQLDGIIADGTIRLFLFIYLFCSVVNWVQLLNCYI